MVCLVQFDQDAMAGVADFGDAVYGFKVRAYSYGAPRPSVFDVYGLSRDGRSVVNPSRASAIQLAVRRAWA
jgi:hypothetical protein